MTGNQRVGLSMVALGLAVSAAGLIGVLLGNIVGFVPEVLGAVVWLCGTCKLGCDR